MDTQIAMLWMRGELSFLEQLCLQSFLDAGHSVVLYGFGDIRHVPDGVERRDAAEVLAPPSELLAGGTEASALYVDGFRTRLLSTRDAPIWVETDIYCRKTFAPEKGHLYGWENPRRVSAAILGLPPDSAALGRLIDLMPGQDAPAGSDDPGWSDWGESVLTRALNETGEIGHALPTAMLFPYGYAERRTLIREGVDHRAALADETVSIRLHGDWTRRRLAERDAGLPHPESLIGQLLQAHRIDPCEAPLPDCPDPDRDHAHARQYREAAGGRRFPSIQPPPACRPLDDVVAVTTMRNEGPFILDWVAYHLGVGVTHFLVYTNDCDDETEAVLDALSMRGLVTRIDNPVTADEKPQRLALDDAATHPLVRRADAVVVLDVDEYINIHVGEGRLEDLFRAAGDPDLISMTWRLFGTSGVTAYEDRLVPELFTRAAPHLTRKPHQAWGFKTIFRREAPFKGFGVHRPQEPTAAEAHWTNGSGEAMPERYMENGWRSAVDCWGYDLVTLNHYAVRSCESFLVKRDRGRSNHVARAQGIDYWNTFNRNDEEDRSILPRLALGRGVRAVFAKDPVLGPLHARAVDWHRARIGALRDTAREAAIWDAITVDPTSHRVPDIDLPEPGDRPITPRQLTAGGFQLRAEPPATGRAAEEQFQGLMARIQKRQDLLLPRNPAPRSEKIVVVTSMKNEGCFILEWVAYHLSIGVTHFLVYTNDCDDPTNAILDRLQALGWVTRRDNPFNPAVGQKPQRGALNDAIGLPVVQEADWVGVIDVDEFVNIHAGQGRFEDLLNAAGDPNVISMTWRFFGNKGVHAYEDRWQTEQFTACAPRYIPKPRLGWGFKSFYRPDGPFQKIGVHRPLDLDPDRAGDVRWVNGAGRVMPERLVQKNEWFSRKDTIGYDLVTLNHYVLRSAESFLVKRQRGRINHVDQDQGVLYWRHRNYATETDRSILAHLPRAREVLVRLLADEALYRLHGQAVAWHKARIATLMAEDEYRALYDAITDPSAPDAIWRERVAGEEEVPLEAAE